MPRHFTLKEVRGLKPRFVEKLDRAREIAGVPFVITSGFRTPRQNAAAGGKPNSSHLRGWGADLRARRSPQRFQIVYGLVMAGFRRVVVYAGDGHVHVDDDPSLTKPVFVVKR